MVVSSHLKGQREIRQYSSTSPPLDAVCVSLTSKLKLNLRNELTYWLVFDTKIEVLDIYIANDAS